MPRSLLGDSMSPRPFPELKAAGSRLGVSLSIGVEVTLLLMLLFEISVKIFADLDRSRRGLLADLFSGEPLLAKKSRLASAKISNWALKSCNM